MNIFDESEAISLVPYEKKALTELLPKIWINSVNWFCGWHCILMRNTFVTKTLHLDVENFIDKENAWQTCAHSWSVKWYGRSS